MAWHQRWSATGLGAFLQRLTTGEAGFMNVCVGSSAFSLAYYKHVQEVKEADVRTKHERYHRHFQHVTDHIYDTEPLIMLSNMERYSHHLSQSAEAELGIEHTTRDELADEWLRRRNRPVLDPDRHDRGWNHAGDIDKDRLKLRRMWRAIMLLHEDPNNDHMKKSDGTDSLHAEIEDSLVKKSLMWLEPLDKAMCRLSPECDWEKHRGCEEYRIYKFMREQWQIAEDWPHEEQNPDDFRPNALPITHKDYKRVSDMVPKSRVAARLHRENEKQVLKTIVEGEGEDREGGESEQKKEISRKQFTALAHRSLSHLCDTEGAALELKKEDIDELYTEYVHDAILQQLGVGLGADFDAKLLKAKIEALFNQYRYAQGGAMAPKAIDGKVFTAAMADMGVEISEAEAQEFILAHDQDQSGDIDILEFEDMVLDLLKQRKKLQQPLPIKTSQLAK